MKALDENCRFPNIIVVVLILMFGFSVMDAQVRKREYLDSINAEMNGYWYHPEFDQYEVQYPKLQIVPPLSMGMDYETLLSYIFLDSVIRTASTELLFINYLDYWKETKTKNDTIIQAVKYLYKIIDYDPIRFAQYNASVAAAVYQIPPDVAGGFIKERLYDIAGEFGPNSQAIEDLIRSDYILKVHVNSVDSMPERNYPPKKGIYPNEFTYKVNATVSDTLKGRVFKNCSPQAILGNPNSGQSLDAQICFTYGTGPYQNDVYPFKLNPALKDGAGNLRLRAGQDVIVSLSYDSYLWDKNYDYFDLSLISVYPVIDGQVKDISHVWSNSVSLNYGDWRAVFDQKKEMLLNGGY